MSELDDLLKILDQAEQQVVASMKPVQVREIVPIDRWMEDEFYVGKDGLRLYPFWKDVLRDVFAGKQRITEVILEGAIGTGKSTVGIYVLIRKLYEMSCFENIPALYDLMSTANVVFMYFNISQTQALLGGFGQVRETLDTIPYFEKHFKRDPAISSIIRLPEKVIFIQGSCMSADTMIYTSAGIVRADKLEDSMKVWDGRRYRNIEYLFTEDDREFYRITLTDGHKIDTVGNHLHYTQRGFVPTEEVKVGDSLFIAPSPEMDGTLQFWEVPLYENNRCGRKTDIIELDEELSELIGWFVGDGSYTTGHQKVRLYGNNSETQVLDKYSRKLNSYTTVPEKRRASDSVWEVNASSKVVTGLFDWLGGPKGATEKEVPEQIMMSPPGIRRAFLRGLFSADGSVKGNAVRYTTYSETLAHQVQTLLCSVGLVGTLSENSFNYEKVLKRRWQIQLAGESNRRFIEQVGFVGEKEEESRAYLRSGKGVNTRVKPPRVKSIERLPNARCYGAKVDGGIYTGNGLLTHNSVSHQIGLNLMATILDEANFFAEGRVADAEALSAVTRLHTSVINRGLSRFMSGGVNNSLSVLISSPSYSSSYTQQRIKQAESNPHTLVVKCRLWDVKPKGTYSAESFHVFIGTEKLEPFIVNSTQDLDVIAQSEGIDHTHTGTLKEAAMKSPVRHLVDSVPIDFVKNYETNIIQSLQDISGISISPQGRLFSSRVALQKCVTEEVPELFFRTNMVIQTEDNSETNNISHYQKADLMDPEKVRYVHIDQSVTTDTTGLAAAHKHATVERDGVQLPIIAIDLALRITPPAAPRKISIGRVRSYVVTLNKDQGIQMGKVTYDSFQSEESRQVLKELGINSDYLSVDRNDSQYLEFVNLVIDGRLIMSQQTHDLIAEEIFDLVHYRARRRVDHLPNGSKDVMDAVVGAVWNAMYSEDTAARPDDVKSSVRHTTQREDDEQQRYLESMLGDYVKGIVNGGN